MVLSDEQEELNLNNTNAQKDCTAYINVAFVHQASIC
jgi:hypothetical protein